MRLVARTLCVVVVACACAAAFLIGRDDVALADTANCVSQGEYQQLQQLQSLATVRAIFDVPGTPEGNSQSGDFYRYSFNACNGWTQPGERVWCWFSYIGLGLDRWAVR